MRLVILDSGLRDQTGHHNTFARRVSTQARANGWPVSIYGHRNMESPLRAELSATPYFSASPYDRASTDPISGDIESFLIQNSLYQRELTALEPDICTPDVLLIVPTITQFQLLGLGQWLGRLPAGSRPRCAVALMFPPRFGATPRGADTASALYRIGLKTLAKAPPGTVSLYAETDEIAQAFADLSDIPIHTIQWPARDPGKRTIGTPSRRTDANWIPTLTYLGHGKAERGFHLLPEIISQVLSGFGGVRFVVQANTNDDTRLIATLEKLASMGPEVSILRGPLDALAFARHLESADLLLLPYDPENYHDRGSGLLAEAIVEGVPVVVPLGTSLADQIKRRDLAGVVADGYTATALAQASIDALKSLPELTRHAASVSSEWAAAGMPSTFIESILATFDLVQESSAASGSSSAASVAQRLR